jgi:D-alanyl-D-alanine carboxypeptidase (penicillin-binding protein 5/6)
MHNKRHIIIIGITIVTLVAVILAHLTVKLPLDSSVAPSESLAIQPDVATARILDLASGEILYELRGDTKLQPGSLTKLMPVYILYTEIENGNISLYDTVTVSTNASTMKGSVAGLPAGAELTIDALLYCILLPSGCDAVTALAEFLYTGTDEMVKHMNSTAISLGMNDTSFVDCTGLQYSQLTTTQDFSLLVTSLLAKYPEVLEYTSLSHKSIAYRLDENEQQLELINTNRLVGNIDGVQGLKTGTVQGIYNVVIVAERDDIQRVIIILGAPDDITRWWEARQLTEYAFTL